MTAHSLSSLRPRGKGIDSAGAPAEVAPARPPRAHETACNDPCRRSGGGDRLDLAAPRCLPFRQQTRALPACRLLLTPNPLACQRRGRKSGVGPRPRHEASSASCASWTKDDYRTSRNWSSLSPASLRIPPMVKAFTGLRPGSGPGSCARPGAQPTCGRFTRHLGIHASTHSRRLLQHLHGQRPQQWGPDPCRYGGRRSSNRAPSRPASARRGGVCGRRASSVICSTLQAWSTIRPPSRLCSSAMRTQMNLLRETSLTPSAATDSGSGSTRANSGSATRSSSGSPRRLPRATSWSRSSQTRHGDRIRSAILAVLVRHALPHVQLLDVVGGHLPLEAETPRHRIPPRKVLCCRF